MQKIHGNTRSLRFLLYRSDSYLLDHSKVSSEPDVACSSPNRPGVDSDKATKNNQHHNQPLVAGHIIGSNPLPLHVSKCSVSHT